MSYLTEFAIYCECNKEEGKLELLDFINKYGNIDEIKKEISELNNNETFNHFCIDISNKFLINFEIDIYRHEYLDGFLRVLIDKLDDLREPIDKLEEVFIYDELYFESTIIGEEITDIEYNYGDKEVISFNRTITINEKLL